MPNLDAVSLTASVFLADHRRFSRAWCCVYREQRWCPVLQYPARDLHSVQAFGVQTIASEVGDEQSKDTLVLHEEADPFYWDGTRVRLHALFTLAPSFLPKRMQQTLVDGLPALTPDPHLTMRMVGPSGGQFSSEVFCYRHPTQSYAVMEQKNAWSSSWYFPLHILPVCEASGPSDTLIIDERQIWKMTTEPLASLVDANLFVSLSHAALTAFPPSCIQEQSVSQRRRMVMLLTGRQA